MAWVIMVSPGWAEDVFCYEVGVRREIVPFEFLDRQADAVKRDELSSCNVEGRCRYQTALACLP